MDDWRFSNPRMAWQTIRGEVLNTMCHIGWTFIHKLPRFTPPVLKSRLLRSLDIAAYAMEEHGYPDIAEKFSAFFLRIQCADLSDKKVRDEFLREAEQNASAYI